MSLKLDPGACAWLVSPATRRVIAALEAAEPGASRFVGGCVRNTLMGRPVDDVDIATRLTPTQVLAALETAGVKAVPTGVEHGTVTAVSEGAPYEITTLRRDVETHGRRAVVAFTRDFAEDAGRRDFRLNAIYADPDGALFDPVGGVADAHAGRVVFIGEADQRILEDYLRILRFFRFTAWYAGAPDPDGLAACVRLKSGLQRLSAERVWKELKKLLAAPAPGRALAAMQEGHVLEEVLTGELDFRLLLSLINRDEVAARPADPLLRVAALAGARGEGMAAIAAAMKTSKAEAERLQAIAGALTARVGEDDVARRAGLYAHGPQGFSDRMRLREAAGLRSPEATARDLALAAEYQRPAPPLKARDLIAAGWSPGPALGAALARAEAAWIASDFTLDRAGLLAAAGDDPEAEG